MRSRYFIAFSLILLVLLSSLVFAEASEYKKSQYTVTRESGLVYIVSKDNPEHKIIIEDDHYDAMQGQLGRNPRLYIDDAGGASLGNTGGFLVYQTQTPEGRSGAVITRTESIHERGGEMEDNFLYISDPKGGSYTYNYVTGQVEYDVEGRTGKVTVDGPDDLIDDINDDGGASITLIDRESNEGVVIGRESEVFSVYSGEFYPGSIKLKDGTEVFESYAGTGSGTTLVGTTTNTIIEGNAVGDRGTVYVVSSSTDSDPELLYSWETVPVEDKVRPQREKGKVVKDDGGDIIYDVTSGGDTRIYRDADGRIIAFEDDADVGALSPVGADGLPVGAKPMSSDGKYYGDSLTPEGVERLKEGKGIRQQDIEGVKKCGKDDGGACLATRRERTDKDFDSIEAGLNRLGEGQAISNLIFGDIYVKEGIADWDRYWSGTVFSEEYWDSLVCQHLYPDIQDQSIVYINTPAGTLQAVAGIHGEVAGDGPILCSYDQESGEYDYCKEGSTCVNEICVDDTTEEAVEGQLYKLTWTVSAPADVALTPNSDEQGVGVTFNILIGDSSKGFNEESVRSSPSSICKSADDGCVRIYAYQGDNTFPFRLKNGITDGSTVAKWSSGNYDTACIVWGRAPVTTNTAKARASANPDQSAPSFSLTNRGEDYAGGGLFIDHICTDLKPSTRGTDALNFDTGSGARLTGDGSSGDEPPITSSNEGMTTVDW